MPGPVPRAPGPSKAGRQRRWMSSGRRRQAFGRGERAAGQEQVPQRGSSGGRGSTKAPGASRPAGEAEPQARPMGLGAPFGERSGQSQQPPAPGGAARPWPGRPVRRAEAVAEDRPPPRSVAQRSTATSPGGRAARRRADEAGSAAAARPGRAGSSGKAQTASGSPARRSTVTVRPTGRPVVRSIAVGPEADGQPPPRAVVGLGRLHLIEVRGRGRRGTGRPPRAPAPASRSAASGRPGSAGNIGGVPDGGRPPSAREL